MTERFVVAVLAAAATLGLALSPGVAQLEIEGLEAEIQPIEPDVSATDRYVVDAAHGTVLDTVTGLVWLETGTCDEIPKIGPLGNATWSDAMRLVRLLADGLCGLADGSRPGDWRLPTQEEWEATIARAVAIGCTAAGAGDPPSLTNTSGLACHADGPSPFSIVQFVYWTSTSDDHVPGDAWAVNLVNGVVTAAPKSNEFVLWAVRDDL